MPDPDQSRRSLGLGIEIGGTKLQLGLGAGDGRIVALERRKIDPTRRAAGILDQIAEAFSCLIARPEVSGRAIDAVGIGFGGPVDAAAGVVTTSHQVDGWDGYPLASWARRHLGIERVILENDADAAALGEATVGAGLGLSPLLYLTIGSGVGGGLIVDGAIYRGAGHGAVEIGHLRVKDSLDGGRPVPLESIASGWAIGRRARDQVARLGADAGPIGLRDAVAGDVNRIDAEVVSELARRGDPIALDVLRSARDAMATALAHAVTLLGPRRVVLGGGVSRIDDEYWMGPIRAEVDRRVFTPFRGTFEIVTTTLGEQAVVHGGIALTVSPTGRFSPR